MKRRWPDHTDGWGNTTPERCPNARQWAVGHWVCGCPIEAWPVSLKKGNR